MNNGPSWLSPLPDGGWQPIKSKVETIRWMFQRAYAGQSAREILKEIADQKMKPVGRKSTWTEGDVAALLANPAVAGLRKTADGLSKTNYPAIIDPDWWRDVQKLRERNRAGKGDSTNLFTGLLFCGKCKTALRFRGFSNRTYVECYNGCLTKKYYNTLELLIIEHVFGHAWYIQPSATPAAAWVGTKEAAVLLESRKRHMALLRHHIDRVSVSNDMVTVVRRNNRRTRFHLPG